MKISTSTSDDIPQIFRLYNDAIKYQAKIFPESVWSGFEEDMVRNEVIENRQFKLMIDDNIACVWAVKYSDPQIWEEKDNTDSIYIHRIATNPDFRGNNFVSAIVDWAKVFAKKKHKKFIRMDTCGDNKRLIKHYTKSGFNYLGMKKLKDYSNLPSHYQEAEVCYFEIKVD